MGTAENKITVSGFTIVRNARRLDYPFRESVLSALPLCDEFIIGCGDSSDDTLAICRELEKFSGGKVRIIESVWQRENQSGGFQLKRQSDIALAECRGDWCFYIQADEVLHESDLPKIRAAIEKANPLPNVDGILFDYLHFYGNFSYIITGRNWYRREVRAFRNHIGIEAFRDAQGFRRNGARLKVIRSGARVFHYGYVRSAVSLQKKSEEMAQWWGKKPDTDLDQLQPRRHVGLKLFQGSQPAVMADRIATNDTYFDPTRCRRKWDRTEIKNALTLLWESIVPFRIGEFRNYELIR